MVTKTRFEVSENVGVDEVVLSGVPQCTLRTSLVG